MAIDRIKGIDEAIAQGAARKLDDYDPQGLTSSNGAEPGEERVAPPDDEAVPPPGDTDDPGREELNKARSLAAELVERAKKDCGVLLEPTTLDALALLASDDPPDWVRIYAALGEARLPRADLKRAIDKRVRQQHQVARAGSPERAKAAAYKMTESGIVWHRPHLDGESAVLLTNFRARITAEVVEDDGVETRRLFEVEAWRSERSARLLVAAASFDNLGWVNDALGASALVYPGSALRDHARFAIRLLSGEVPEQRVYTSTGWREVEPGGWAYLHAGGAIGAAAGTAVTVRLPEALSSFHLPAPPEGEARRLAVRASLNLLNLADDTLMFPTTFAPYRAAIAPADMSMHYVGRTGVFKTELAALQQQHFGATMDARHLPGSWSSTDNALEAGAFTAACAVYAIDDFAPGGAPADVQRLHAKADRVFRNQGNQAGRGRLRPDGSPRPVRPPRGLIVSTGEDIPRGQSLRSRILILEVGPDDIAALKLTCCQRDAANGLYAEAMAGFLAWLAPQYAAIRAGMTTRLMSLRQDATEGAGHRRTPAIVAELAFGLELFLRYAQEVGAVTAGECQSLWERGWKALGVAASRQAQHQQASEPARRFLELLAAGLSAGRCHIATLEGGPPANAGAWGWRSVPAGPQFASEWRPQGLRVGWLEVENVYLNPEESYNCVQRIGADGGESLAVSSQTLRKRLKERGLLAATETARETLTVRRSIEGKSLPVLHLLAARLMPTKPDKPDNSPPESGSPGTQDSPDCQVSMSGFPPDVPEPDIKTRQESDPFVPAEEDAGRVCQVCRVSHTYSAEPAEESTALPDRERGQV